jgi:(1->4)-alpha-D-glucan 1-alpha-D-glucosylmutase
MLLTTVGLRLRRERPDLFLAGRYVALRTDTAVRAELVAFARIHEGDAVLFVAPRLVAPLVSDERPVPSGGEAWKTSRVLLPSELAGCTFRNELTGAEIKPTSAGDETWLFAARVFEAAPVAMLRMV